MFLDVDLEWGTGIDSSETSALFWPCIAIATVHIFDALCYMIQGEY